MTLEAGNLTDLERGGVSDKAQVCPTPEQVPEPLMEAWIQLRNDKANPVKIVPDEKNEWDTHYLFSASIPDAIFAVVPHGADSHNRNVITRIDGDRYQDGKRIAYYGQSFPTEGTMRLVAVEFGWNGNTPYVAKQTAIYTQLESSRPKDTFVYEARFDKDGHLTNYMTGTSTGTFGFQTPGSAHYRDYMRQLHPTICKP
jgi:hypothetical protein